MVVESNIKATKEQVKNRLEDILATLKRCKEQKMMPPFGMLSEASGLAAGFPDADILKLLKEISVTEQEVVKTIAQSAGVAPDELRNFYNLLASDPLKAAEYYFNLDSVKRIDETLKNIFDEKAPLPSDESYLKVRKDLKDTHDMREALAPALAVEVEILKQKPNPDPVVVESCEAKLDKIGKQRVAHAVMKKHREQPNIKEEMLDMRNLYKIFAENSIFYKDFAAVPEHKMDHFVITSDINFLKEAMEMGKAIFQEQAAAKIQEENQARALREAESIRREFEESREREQVTAKKTEQELVVEVVTQDPKEEVGHGKEVKKGALDLDNTMDDLEDDLSEESVHFVPEDMRKGDVSKVPKYDPHPLMVHNKKNSGKSH